MARDERKLARRLAAARGGQAPRGDGLEFAGNPRLELAERTRAMPYGGIGTMLKLVRDVGLAGKLDEELDVIQRPHPYTDAAHVLNIAFNILCGGRVLDDIEVRRSPGARWKTKTGGDVLTMRAHCLSGWWRTASELALRTPQVEVRAA